jgi:hypothetical protein
MALVAGLRPAQPAIRAPPPATAEACRKFLRVSFIHLPPLLSGLSMEKNPDTSDWPSPQPWRTSGESGAKSKNS